MLISEPSYPYEAVWIAANVHVLLPTPRTHPDFPLWELGYEARELWDIFGLMASSEHLSFNQRIQNPIKRDSFCRHPKIPITAGRFGPSTDKY